MKTVNRSNFKIFQHEDQAKTIRNEIGLDILRDVGQKASDLPQNCKCYTEAEVGLIVSRALAEFGIFKEDLCL
jgi:hypothetical protein